MDENLRVKRLLMHSMALNKSISELWSVYQEVFESIDLDDPAISDTVVDMLAELEYNLIDILDQVSGQIYLTTGIYEPIPFDSVDDFESAVLRTIGNLDEVNLEDYRMEYEDYGSEE